MKKGVEPWPTTTRVDDNDDEMNRRMRSRRRINSNLVTRMADWKCSRLPTRRGTSDADLGQRWLIGFAGGLLASLAMNLFARAVTVEHAADLRNGMV